MIRRHYDRLAGSSCELHDVFVGVAVRLLEQQDHIRNGEVAVLVEVVVVNDGFDGSPISMSGLGLGGGGGGGAKWIFISLSSGTPPSRMLDFWLFFNNTTPTPHPKTL